MRCLAIIVMSAFCAGAGLFGTSAMAEPLEPGYYAAVCNVLGSGATEKEAIAQCTRAVKNERGLSRRFCDCKKYGDVVRITKAMRPAYFIAGWAYTSASGKAATAKCLAEQKAYVKKGYGTAKDDWECDKITWVYGPFSRKKAALEYDDAHLFRYLTDSGGWVDERGEGPCFARGTPVLTPDGERPIESFVPGDAVVTWSTTEGRFVVGAVVRVKSREVSEALVVALADGRTLTVTPNHPLWVEGAGWVEAGALTAGDVLGVHAASGLGASAIVSIDHAFARAGEAVEVWDLTVTPTHDFFAAGVLAHNY